MIGFLGPKVYKAIYGEDFPAGVQQAENLHQQGIVDAVIEPRHLR
jgi:acyl-CoA carboxylase subunit beta